ncbi:MAG: hypothetical protein PHG79_11395 [Methanosarcina sp.]|nr:hypothetical protein [Methanosarcina sp.]MDD3874186.1 hypothetical protein [Methanosarcina sp.]MDD4523511.1 hypothetical protein [Methanosarcina sp.]HHV24634.1 hypothetical protein [Methanosarcina sp.]
MNYKYRNTSTNLRNWNSKNHARDLKSLSNTEKVFKWGILLKSNNINSLIKLKESLLESFIKNHRIAVLALEVKHGIKGIEKIR